MRKDSGTLLRKKFANPLCFFMDQISLVSQAFFGLMHLQINNTSNPDKKGLFGLRSVMAFGDQFQLSVGSPLYVPNPGETKDGNQMKIEDMCNSFRQRSILGRDAWLHFVFSSLNEVNRYIENDSGRTLASIVMDVRQGGFSDATADTLQTRYIGNKGNDISMSHNDWKSALLLSTRNMVLTEGAAMLAVSRGRALGETVYVWDSIDMYDMSGGGGTLSAVDYACVGKLDFSIASTTINIQV
jgi:hypothetical protein